MAQTYFCKKCYGKNCNVKREFQQCYLCNSRDSSECSQNAGSSTRSAQCDNYLATCLTGIDAHGYTHRRCSVDYDTDSLEFPNNQFTVCTKNRCNSNIYPANRLQCYECNGERECDYMTSTSNSTSTSTTKQPKFPHRLLKPCAVLSKFDQCYAYLSIRKF